MLVCWSAVEHLIYVEGWLLVLTANRAREEGQCKYRAHEMDIVDREERVKIGNLFH